MTLNSNGKDKLRECNFKPLHFFLQEGFTHTKSTKRIQADKNKKDSIFMRIKNI